MLIKTCLLQGMGLSRGPEEGSLVCLALPGRFRQTVSRGRLGSGVKKKKNNQIYILRLSKIIDGLLLKRTVSKNPHYGFVSFQTIKITHQDEKIKEKNKHSISFLK